jgi:mannose/cellobiose epimerase-like protein (N-acyl-D-glucosamine 2-epimerase family)
MKRLLLFLCVFLSPVFAQRTYIPSSDYLRTPAMVINYVDSCAKFWTNVYDPAFGGYWTNVDSMGHVITAWGTNKNMMNQTRDAYGFTRAFQLTGNATYLVYARRALDFMYKSAWDKTNGGWMDNISKSGTPNTPTENKSAYNQHYAMLGITAYYEATRDTADFRRLNESYAWNDAKLWDARPDKFGYYDYALANGASPTDKSFNATVDAITTHLLHLYLLTGDTLYYRRMAQVADNMLNRLTASVDQQTIGFCEKYDSDWNPRSSTQDDRMTIMGHVLKTAWCFARLYQFDPKPEYLAAAEKLVAVVWNKGYDHQNGGPYKDYDRTTGSMLMWGKTDTAKAWWQMEQAVTSGLFLYEITGKNMYLQMADETLLFFMKYFVDHTYGEVYENRTKYGKQIWDTDKGSSGKAAYHSIELGYYVYLYGNLLLNKKPATLYYSIAPSAQERQLRMNPISSPAKSLCIASVRRNDTLYTNFDPQARTLTVPAGTGGIFAVTYVPAGTCGIIAQKKAAPVSVLTARNYPNPFNGETQIHFTLPESGPVSLTVYDILGREVSSLIHEEMNPGEYTVRWNATAQASGIYFSILRTATHAITNRMVITR